MGKGSMTTGKKNHPSTGTEWRFLRNVLVKAGVLFILFNLIFTLFPVRTGAAFSLYNRIFPGRERLPFGENPREAYNLSLYDFKAMFASHKISEAKSNDEFRVLLIGDSSVWGTLLEPDESLAGWINAAGLVTCGGERIQAYNLGYPTLSLFKDLAVLHQAMQYQPDLILWPLTLESFPLESQLSTPIIANNPDLVRELMETYALSFDMQDAALVTDDFWDRTIIGRRRDLADRFRLQAYGFMWAATGIDQVYPGDYPAAQRDLENDLTFHGFTSQDEIKDKLAFELLDAGVQAAEGVPVWFINEPMLISDGQNSDLRYNFFYPRWAYDRYREILTEKMLENDWVYLDLWDLVEQDEFTNSAIHLTPAGSRQLADRLVVEIQERYCIE